MVDELAQATDNTDMVRIHLDDQMDSKSLLGAYICTAVPGEFVWQPGPLTQAVLQVLPSAFPLFLLALHTMSGLIALHAAGKDHVN